MTVSLPGMLAGALTALGLALAVRALLPRRVPLAKLLARTHHPAPPQQAVAATGSARARWAEQVGTRLLETGTVAARLPAKDLSLLEMRPASLLGRCAVYGLLGMLLPQWMLLLLTLGGLHLPFAVPVAFALIGGVVFVFKCFDDVRTQARQAREEYQFYAASLLERVALARASAGASEALMQVTTSADGRAAVRIRDTLEHARLSGVNLWDALEQLGQDIGVPELSRPAASMALAGEEHAAVTATLEAQSAVTRRTTMAARRAEANEKTEAMTVPALAIVFLMVIFAVVPPLLRIMTF
ncbi:type II secretion system F family protein [Streptomyces violascens]|uniref:type II secretion system F family protein n=1 Tax=Streptomyces violascens TaxID=67381 RepID=UPI003681B695